MALTDPFPADIEARLAQPIRHLYQVTILPVTGPAFDVAVERSGTFDVTFDMDWTPYCQAQVSIKKPTDATQLAAMDSRLGTRMQIKAGYHGAGYTTLCTLRLHQVREAVPGDVLELTGHGAEMLLLDRHALKEGPSAYDNYTNRTGLVDFVKSWINRCYEPGPKPAILSTVPGGMSWNWLTEGYQHDGGTCWSAVAGVIPGAGVRVYDDGSGTWRIEYMPALSTDYAAKLKVGSRGTVTSADKSIDRERWYNQVRLQYDWTTEAGAANTVSGYARVTSGPQAATATNTREYVEYRQGPVSQDTANAWANYLLDKYMQRGRQLSLTAAAAYWLRPGHTVPVKLDAGNYQRLLVAAVTFSPINGQMAVRTLRPEDYETGA
jgi:hypothetical protein